MYNAVLLHIAIYYNEKEKRNTGHEATRCSGATQTNT
jgi:hypothetical protein